MNELKIKNTVIANDTGLWISARYEVPTPTKFQNPAQCYAAARAKISLPNGWEWRSNQEIAAVALLQVCDSTGAVIHRDHLPLAISCSIEQGEDALADYLKTL